ncbi:DNA polymerase III subunit delta' [Ignatzschineria rhizosphaerae]|uniref:DNA-directed DNA polymerase n=1 Tax=Ignatzschineria rhizosphaerae TaxID=2923279 RepID=A0ABY3X100_9GAMM|nr:DNA polymerase III subunit delta' [Ignatzschineria rhizosphaerae]UNM96509.1 DNA polymerase III subunit delta' [Ignatzschineria rhizosphaerae]
MEDKVVAVNFQEVPWLQKDYHELLMRFKGQKPPHALMLYGKEGVGKVCLADALVSGILCRELKDGLPCGVCQSCRWIASGFHPDLYEIKGEAEIKVDEIRNIQQFARLTPETGKKVVVIKHADRMNLNAANSLLKVLEEPPTDLFFILESSSIEKLPITVRSRCQDYFVHAPSVEEALFFLQDLTVKKGQQINAEVLRLLLAISFDAPFKALSYLEDNYLEKRGNLLQTIHDLLSREISPAKGVAALLESEDLSFSYLFFLLTSSFEEARRSLFPNLEAIFMILLNMPEKMRLLQYEKLVEINRLRSSQTRTDWALEAWFVDFLG